jgi:hypothetical protein
MPAAITGLVMRELNIALVPYRLVFVLNTIHDGTWQILDEPATRKYGENTPFKCGRVRRKLQSERL